MAIDISGPALSQNLTTPASKLRWGELDEDDGEDLDFLLPPRQVIGPDENGVKKVVEYKFNDEGNKVKITTTTRIQEEFVRTIPDVFLTVKMVLT
ncbi:hypothetical protein F0562_021999 [Nyssa sinensis]|uniref:Eukaryotic translation initiation factor 3 subunit G N-terminal domain-containing protein n=1 Tax=Nyssa sinensis TaxID=561372 RepID=A0A5J5BMB9_9ASTE|nr:hypothetical protein F0562_021999 [Nyssa sinensis]